MAKKRYINTKFWSDNFVVELNSLDRYLFLYFLTNEHTNICGIYELPKRTMSFETGIETEMIDTMIKRLDGRVYYINGWIYIKNFAKHQAINPNIEKGIERVKKELPDEILNKINEIDEITGSLSKSIEGFELLKPKLKPKPKPKLESIKLTPSQIAKSFFNSFINDKIIKIDLLSEEWQDRVSQLTDIQLQGFNLEIAKFVSYWTELNKTGTKQAWETKPTFEVGKRLGTWFNNYKDFNNNSEQKITSFD